MTGRRFNVLTTAAAILVTDVALIAGAVGIARADAPAEDDPGWSCVDDGNHVCGPGNANGAPAGCYDDGGVLAAPWPCSWHTVDNGTRLLITADGDAQLYLPAGDEQ